MKVFVLEDTEIEALIGATREDVIRKYLAFIDSLRPEVDDLLEDDKIEEAFEMLKDKNTKIREHDLCVSPLIYLRISC